MYSQPLLKTLLMHPLEQLQLQVFFNMKQQAWHTFLLGFTHFYLLLFAAPLKLLQVGWETLVHSHFQISPEMFNWILVCLGHSKTFTELL